MSTTRILVTGATGFLGPWAVSELARRGCSVVTAARKDADIELDLTRSAAVADLLKAASPDRVLHLAAMSRMELCAADPGRAFAINARITGELAAAMGQRMLHVSTDLVFDGSAAPYGPDSTPSPLSEYGSSKAEGEAMALAAGARVARLPLLFGPDERGRGASEMVLRAVRTGSRLGLYTNEYRTPLLVADAARGLADLLLGSGLLRIAHLPGPERVSRWELGRRLCVVLDLPADILEPVECSDPQRPRDVSLAGEWENGRTLDEACRECGVLG